VHTPWIGRFIQPDTIVPQPGNPQALNRYAYVLNNPLKYTDPSGHAACYDTGLEIGPDISQADCWAYGADKWISGLPVSAPAAGQGYSTAKAIASLIGFFGYGAGGGVTLQVPTSFAPNINFKGWSDSLKGIALEGAYVVAQALYALTASAGSGATLTDVFNYVFGQVNVEVNSSLAAGSCFWNENVLGCNTAASIGGRLFAHELGHIFNARFGGVPYLVLGLADIRDDGNKQIAGRYPGGGYLRTFDGYIGDYVFNDDPLKVGEDFADMFGNWAYKSFLNDPRGAGAARYAWMATHIRIWVQLKVQLDKTK
jgi:hypothetical protein